MIVYNAELGIRKELGVGNRKINELLAVYTYTANIYTQSVTRRRG